MAAKRRALAERRRSVGLSQERLAEALEVEPSTVGRWERGETAPQPWFRPKLARALAVSVEELDHLLVEVESLTIEQQRSGTSRRVDGLRRTDPAEGVNDDPDNDPMLSAPWSHRGTVEAAVVLSGGDWRVDRRRFGLLAGAALTVPAHQWLIHDPDPLVAGLSGGHVSATLADQLPTMITTLRTMDDVAGGGTVLSLAQQAFDWVARLLDQASYDERTGRKLYIALAELGQLTGWVAHDAGQSGLGQRYHIAALHAAHSADDRPLGAHILACMADQAARHGRPAEAVTLIDTAAVGVRGRETPRLLAELYIRKAYALAILQDASACTTAVSKARTQVEEFESEPDNDPLWLYWVSPAEITAGTGDCLLQLGRAEEATALLDNGIAMFDESFTRDRQIYLTHLADALARPGKQRDLDAAVDRGLAAVLLTESLASTRAIECLHELYARMQPHAPAPAVRDFLQRARAVLAA